MKVTTIKIIFISIALCFGCSSHRVKQNSSFSEYSTWSEEFNYTGFPDSNKWSFDKGMGQNGWGNNEQQYYVKNQKQVWVADGHLKITATQEDSDSIKYKSAKIHTKGKFEFLYGRIEVAAIVPDTKGSWPAIWLMPSESVYGTWPLSGEIDIMEHVGYDLNNIHSSVHTKDYNGMKGTHKTRFKYVVDATKKLQVYRLDWTPTYIKSYVNDKLIFSYKNQNTGSGQWPFDHSFYIILNLAIGGNWGGKKGIDRKQFPAAFLIDYIRYYPYIL